MADTVHACSKTMHLPLRHFPDGHCMAVAAAARKVRWLADD